MLCARIWRYKNEKIRVLMNYKATSGRRKKKAEEEEKKRYICKRVRLEHAKSSGEQIQDLNLLCLIAQTKDWKTLQRPDENFANETDFLLVKDSRGDIRLGRSGGCCR